MTNKVLREKPNHVVCQSAKLRFLKQKHKNKKKLNDNTNRSKKQFFQIIKTCIFIQQKNFKNTQVTRFKKKLILISKN